MENNNLPRLSVSDFIAATNQTLEYAYPSVEVVGEVQGFKVNQNKFVFFDLKDDAGSISCFMTVWQLRTPLEDGMQIVVRAMPKLTTWGKFSLTIKTIQLLGEGNLRRSFELLKNKLSKEGLFDPARKRALPRLPARIGVISSTQAAGYADFISILGERWGGLEIEVAHVQVQGGVAADQIIRALRFFNQTETAPEVIALLRGGGSLDDLSSFNDEQLVRAIASSRAPVITGIGHETDLSLADLAADYRAATPSNAAQVLVPDRREVSSQIHHQLKSALRSMQVVHDRSIQQLGRDQEKIEQRFERRFQNIEDRLRSLRQTIAQLNPKTALRRGYAIVRHSGGQLAGQNTRRGQELSIELKKVIITAGVLHVITKKNQ